MMSELRELHDELRAVTSEVLARANGVLESRQLADAGWLGLEIPESLGGAGASFAETAIVLEALGRSASSSHYLGAVLAVGALTALPPNTSRDALLEGLGTGTSVTLASGFSVSDGVVSGRAEFVPDAAGAETVLLLADHGGEPAIVCSPDLTVVAQPVLDETRSLAIVTADRAAVAEAWPLPLDPAVLHDRAAAAIACDSLGVAEAMLSATVDYVKVRQQFGRPIGSFQAVKHACADMLVKTTVARHLVNAAVTRVADGADASVSVAMAKSYACGAAVEVAGKAMQLHGGIGYTWESGVHAYLKRAMLNRALYGSPAEHRKRLAARYP
jgi:alkylation response protein AidB-like acyl-CoA dehydrogenase